MAKKQKEDPLVPVTFAGKMQVVGFNARNLQTGNKVRMVLECDWDEEVAAKVAHMFDKRFDIDMKQIIAPVLPFKGASSDGEGEPPAGDG